MFKDLTAEDLSAGLDLGIMVPPDKVGCGLFLLAYMARGPRGVSLNTGLGCRDGTNTLIFCIIIKIIAPPDSTEENISLTLDAETAARFIEAVEGAIGIRVDCDNPRDRALVAMTEEDLAKLANGLRLALKEEESTSKGMVGKTVTLTEGHA